MTGSGATIPADQASVGAGATTPKLRLDVAIGWATGSAGFSILMLTVNSLILKYVVDVLLVSAAVAGTLITVTRLYDAAIDPIMGSISDQTRSRWGRRRPYLFVGAILCALAPLAVFGNPGGLASSMPIVFLTLALLYYSTATTIFNVPYLAMSFELTPSPKERVSLMSYRVYAMSAGGIIAQAMAPWLVTAGGGGQEGFTFMAIVLSALIAVACFISFFATKNALSVDVAKKAEKPQWRDFGKAFGNQPFRCLILAKVPYMLGQGVMMATLAFYITAVLERPLAVLGLIGGAVMLFVVISQPFWVWVCNRIGKRRAFMIATPFNAICTLSWLIADPSEPEWLLVLRGALIGLAGGGMLLAIQAMLPDVLQHEADRGEKPQEGVLTGVFTSVERGISAISVALAGALLSIGGYVGGQEVQGEDAITAIYICVGLLPAIGMALAMVAMHPYRLKE